MKKCNKCNSKANGTIRVRGGENFYFCTFCSICLDKIPPMALYDFLQPDSSKREDFPFTQIERDMLNAKERRKEGKSIWKDAVLGTL